MKPAVCTIGSLAVVALSAWLAWWFLTHNPESTRAFLTPPYSAALVLAWATGTVLVWRYPWAAALTFTCAAVLTLTSGDVLPSAALLFAVSAALGAWSVLAGLSPKLPVGARPPASSVAIGGVSESHTIGLRSCVVCHRPSVETVCDTCGSALGEQRRVWAA